VPVVEDEWIVSAVISAVLRGHGYRVLQAAKGVGALAVANRHAEHSLDLVIADRVLPQMSGTELAEHLRARWPDIKILFTTGYLEGMITSEEISAFGGSLLEKPFIPDALLAKVRQALKKT
jgi:CheY-like chemotaxis protein